MYEILINKKCDYYFHAILSFEFFHFFFVVSIFHFSLAFVVCVSWCFVFDFQFWSKFSSVKPINFISSSAHYHLVWISRLFSAFEWAFSLCDCHLHVFQHHLTQAKVSNFNSIFILRSRCCKPSKVQWPHNWQSSVHNCRMCSAKNIAQCLSMWICVNCCGMECRCALIHRE